MFYNQKTYTVESVTSGHPDKVCDQISDAVLDECLKQDPKSRVAVETFGCHGLLVVGGEITSIAKVDFEKIARQVYQDIGYQDNLKVLTQIVQQSPDIAQGVDTGGAGDQGLMYGFATDETPEFLPLAVVRAHQLAQGLEKLRRADNKNFWWLKPDGKTQVTIENGKIKTVLVSCQHDEKIEQADIRNLLIEHLIKPIIGDISDIEILVNPTGKFVQGGFTADTGLTGRKIMVDTYGGVVPHGGGCFSGKDATKVDRSGAYMARFAAKNLVAQGSAKKCLVSVAYAIGRAEPLMVEAINEKGESLADLVKEKFDFRPKAIIERLNLRQPVFRQTAAYGHFGRPGFSWEEIVKS
jgi:S-adenosylmethionine synthetase